MYKGKPIIGLSGGIGAGKTFVGGIFAELNCLVISSDALIRDTYLQSDLKEMLRAWWGEGVFTAEGEVNRPAIARRIFNSETDRRRIEAVLHPRVELLRQARLDIGAVDDQVVAFVWDSPLLFEKKLASQCDATVFVDAPEALRLSRVQASRGWDAAELTRREYSQLPLDKKRATSDHVIVNTTTAESTRDQVRELLSRILAGAESIPPKARASPE